MTYEAVKRDNITTAGKEMRTSNEIERAEGRIAKFWKEFMSTNGLDLIAGKVNRSALYGIYYNYESDMDGEYSFMLGAEVIDKDTLQPASILTLDIPAQHYAVFTAGGLHEIRNTWREIWSSDLKRAYGFDFEEYEPEFNQVKIYISIL